MKIKLSNILLLAIAFFVFSADSCDADLEDQKQMQQEIFQARMDTITQSLQSEYLPESTKFAFEQKAKQKLIDFGEYFSLYSNTSTNTGFKETAMELLRDLRYDERNTMVIHMDSHDNIERVTLEALTDVLSRMTYDAILFNIDSVEVVEPLERKNESTYKGKLKYIGDWNGIFGSDTIHLSRSLSYCDFYAFKEKKTFGNTTTTNWKVFLGDMD